MQRLECVRQLTRAELDKEDETELAVQVHRTMVRLVQQNIDCLRRQLDWFEKAVNDAGGREKEFVSRLLSEAEKKLGAKIRIEETLSADRLEVTFVYKDGTERIDKVDLNELRGFRLDQWFWNSAWPWLMERYPEFLRDLNCGARILEAVKKGGRKRAESYYERDFRWKDEVEELRKKGQSIRGACRIIGAKEGCHPDTIRKKVSAF